MQPVVARHAGLAQCAYGVERDVFVTASGTLDVFDAKGVTDCSGGVCSGLDRQRCRW